VATIGLAGLVERELHVALWGARHGLEFRNPYRMAV
jgi:hypothetical protein